jgi:hypothetical protein
MRPNSVLALYVVLLFCAGMALGNILNAMDASLLVRVVAYVAVLGGIATWFNPRFWAYRKQWSRS